MLSGMKLTDDQKIQIFCAALSGVGTADKPVEAASALAMEAITKLETSDEWNPKKKSVYNERGLSSV
jgi:hypothetical protein